MSGLDSPDVSAAYDAVRSDKDDTNWLLLSYAGAMGDKLVLSGTGSGGLQELGPKLDDGQAQYAYVRIEYANDTESTRVKFVLLIWIGENTKVMRKARVSIESGAVKRVLSHHSISVDARDRGDIDQDEIVARLRRAGGADYNGGRG
ncbi:actin depolymerizing protein [Annulohypoxylon maeteangense]|uniref:actin depolymerizing protein n=1 Tax=Annulohypoxylon maeteangense TaxID=1927788 RepID=UPI0020080A95|nr:actin depolymerizing protein [Annulohypoxylon maeteangense]KAI0883067.1 actin depolymerizing protein [Annulohypoxylon maeteangense]